MNEVRSELGFDLDSIFGPTQSTYAKTMLITPEMAKAFLLRNKNNRTIRRTVVESYKKDIIAGRWQWTHQGAAFDCSRNMVDGQHRMTAIVETGIPVRMVVWFNVPYSANAPLDRGLVRSTTDNTGIPELECVIARSLYNLVTNDFRPQRVSDGSVSDVYYQFKDNIDAVLDFSKTIPECPRRLTGGFYAGCVFSYPLAPDKVLLFIKDVKTGEGLTHGKPAKAFRDWFIGRLKRYMPNELAMVTISALEYEIRGGSLERIKIPSEGLPRRGYDQIRKTVSNMRLT